MPTRVRFKHDLGLSSNSNEQRELGAVKLDVICDTLGEAGTQKTFVAAGAVDVQLQYGQIADAKLIQLKIEARDPNLTLGEIRLKKNSTLGEFWSIVPLNGTKVSFFMVTSTGVTALYVSNPGTVAVDVTVSAAGD